MGDNSKKPNRVNVRLSDRTLDRVADIAVREERSVSSVVRRLVEAGLRCQEPKK